MLEDETAKASAIQSDPAAPDRRLARPYALAYLATLVTGPLLVSLYVLAAFTDDVSTIPGIFLVGWLYWGIPTAIGGAVILPIVRRVCARLGGEPLWGARLKQVGFGLLVGAAMGVAIAFAPMLLMALASGPAILGALPIFGGYGVVTGGATGLIWAAWFVVFDALIRPKP